MSALQILVGTFTHGGNEMASLTAGTFLMIGKTSSGSTTYSKLVDISEYPDIGSSVDSQDVTTLSDASHKYIDALPDVGGSIEFNGWLNDEDYTAVTALVNKECDFVIAFGGHPVDGDSSRLEPDTITGAVGGPLTITKGTGQTDTSTFLAVSFKGKIRVRLTGAGTDAARPVTYTVTPTTGFVDDAGVMI